MQGGWKNVGNGVKLFHRHERGDEHVAAENKRRIEMLTANLDKGAAGEAAMQIVPAENPVVTLYSCFKLL